jgi:hypothetical protein
MLKSVGTYARKADLRSRPIISNQQGTWYGAAETILKYSIVIGFFVWFTVQFFEQTVIVPVQITTDGNIYPITLQCVSLGGCNISYVFSETGACGALANRPSAFYNDTELFTVDICRDPNDPNAGVNLRSVFNLEKQWFAPRSKLHVAELVQGTRIPTPLVPMTELRSRIIEFNLRIDTDATSLTSDKKLFKSQWNLAAPGYAIVDKECFELSVPYPLLCGSYRLQPSQYFNELQEILSNNVRADVFAPVIAILSILSVISIVIARYCCNDGIRIGPKDEENDEELSYAFRSSD